MSLLNKGDYVGLIASSEPITAKYKQSLAVAVAFFDSLGLKSVFGKHIFSKSNNLLLPELRADDINTFIQDTKIKAIINLWGGYNSSDVLPHINWQLLKTNCKLVIGASDFTSVLNAMICNEINSAYLWINAIWLGLDRYKSSKNTFIQYFFNEPTNESNRLIISSTPKLIKSGVGEGQIIGGNLSTFTRLIGTPYFPKTSKTSVIILENTSTTFEETQAMLNHLRLTGEFGRCKGLILGRFNDLSSKSITNKVVDIVKGLCQPYTFPIIQIPTIGHEVGNEVIPLGKSVSISAKNTIRLQIL